LKAANSVISTASTTHSTVRASSDLLRLGLARSPDDGLKLLDICC
jgi:hypothetical protein